MCIRDSHVDFESDIYSLGIVMYEMVSGKVPFTGDNPVTVALKHMQEPPPGLLAQREDVPLGLERIIFKALEKNPAYRFKSMEEMADALIDLQLYLEERGYFNGSAGRAAVPEQEYSAPNYREPERDTTVVPHNQEENSDDYTRVMKHNYLREEERKKKTNKRNMALLAVAAIVLFFGSFLAVQGLMSKDEVAVPDLQNKTLLEAEELLSEAKLTIKVDEKVYDDEIEKDHIVSQQPTAQTMVKEGREILVTVSLGSNEVQVPDLKGKTEQEARIELENAELELGTVTMVTDSKQPADVVVYQSVEAETTVEAGTKVDVMINEKEAEPEVQTTSVPSLTGKTLDEARKALAAANLKEGSVNKVSSNTHYNNYVVEQGAAAGSSVAEGTAVNLTVSSGPGPETSAQFELIIPEDGTVVVTLKDTAGTSELYQKECVAGERVQQSFLYHGKGTVTITCNGKEIWSQEYGS